MKKARKNEFLPTNKYAEKKKKKLLKNLLVHKPPKRHLGLKITALTLTMGALAFVSYSKIAAYIYNNRPQTKDPHSAEEVIDPNGNDVTFDDNGQIDVDNLDENQKSTMRETFCDFIIKDANSRSAYNIDEVSEVISFSLLPYNLCNENNEYDKYYISILFKSSDDIFAINYLGGTDFESSAGLSVDYFSDFIHYLGYECALDNCQKMSEAGKEVKDALGQEVSFVGDAYLGYEENGDEYYFIPAYTSGGKGTVYSTWSASVESLGQDPMQLLLEELPGAGKNFTSTPFFESENLQKASNIYTQKLQPSKDEGLEK